MEDFMTMYHLELEEERHRHQKEREIMRQQREQEVYKACMAREEAREEA